MFLSRRTLNYTVGAVLTICLLYSFGTVSSPRLSAGLGALNPLAASVASKKGSEANAHLAQHAIQDTNECPPPALSTAAPLPPTPPQPIVLTLVLMGQTVAHEGLVAIKSALMLASRPLDIHLICTEDVPEIVEPKLNLIKRPYYPVNVTFHVITPKRVEDRLRRAGLGTNWKFLTKLLIHEILVDVERTIFMDTDMIFVVDPVQLWDTFDTSLQDKQKLVALPTLGPNSHAGEICTCVMLMDLARMRDPSPSTGALLIPSNLHRSSPDLLNPVLSQAEAEGIPNMEGRPLTEMIAFSRQRPPFADQGIIYVLWKYRPELFARLSMRWDLTHCRDGYGLRLGGFVDKKGGRTEDESEMTEEEQLEKQIWEKEELVLPGILHFNCQIGENVWEWVENHDSNEKTWAPMLTTIVRYKWIWLNRGNGSAKVTIVRRSNIRWLDERRRPSIPHGGGHHHRDFTRVS